LSLSSRSSYSDSSSYLVCYCDCPRRSLHSFPTRRSSDLAPLDLLQNQLTDNEVANMYRQRMPFQVLLKMSGPVMKPNISFDIQRSEEHTSELQSRENLVCRLLLEKKKTSI